MDKRKSELRRETRETKVDITLNLDGNGKAEISTGVGFLDHMLTLLARHASFDLKLTCKGDLNVEDHHTVEDCGIVLGSAVLEAVGERRGIKRFASSYVPMDEALARVVIDLSGRPCSVVNMDLKRDSVGDLACENIPHFIKSFAIASKTTIHADVIRGDNDHHKAEAVFKALALALKDAVRIVGTEIPSTKGVI